MPDQENTTTTAPERDVAADLARHEAELARLEAYLLEHHADEIKGDPETHPNGVSAVDVALRLLAELKFDADRYKADHQGACELVAAMHAAATGRTGEAPARGVVEDVADVAAQLRIALARNAVLERDLAAARREVGQVSTPMFHAAAVATGLPEMFDDEPQAELTDEQRIDAIAVTPELEAVRDDPAAQPSPHLLTEAAKIAGMFRGLAYDPHERPTEVLAVRRAAVAHGLVPVPDESLMRSIKGCIPPVAPGQAIGQAAVDGVRVTPLDADPVGAALERIRPVLEQLAGEAAARRPRPRPAGGQ